MSPLVIPVVVDVVILIGHLSPTPERFILLPDADGQVGQLVVRSGTSQQVLDKAAIASRPVPEITVIGHTGRVGILETNDALSLQRAQAVRELLQASGIQATMKVAGRGEREALVPTVDKIAEAANRRVGINLS